MRYVVCTATQVAILITGAVFGYSGNLPLFFVLFFAAAAIEVVKE